MVILMFEFDSFDGNDDFQNPTFMIIDNSKQMLYVTDSGNDRIVIFELVTGTTCPSGTNEVVDGFVLLKSLELLEMMKGNLMILQD